MPRYKNLSILFYIIFLFFLFLSLNCIIWFFFGVEKKNCEPIILFKQLAYVKLKTNFSEVPDFKYYEIFYYYKIWTLTHNRFQGIPIIFVCGNAGEFTQIRHMANVAQTMWESYYKYLNYSRHLDFFTLEFNNEQSGLTDDIISRQTRYTRKCIEHILSLYNDQVIILVGHSMGGLIVRSVLLEPNFDFKPIKIIITIATPHILPVLGLDNQIYQRYESVNSFWIREWNEKLQKIALISISGNERDFLVWEGYGDVTFLDSSSVNSSRLLWLSISSISGQLLSADHANIMECRQLIVRLCRAIYSTIINRYLKSPENIIRNMKSTFLNYLGSQKKSCKRDTLTNFTVVEIKNTSIEVGNKFSSSVSEIFKIGPVNLSNPNCGIYISVRGVRCPYELFVSSENQSQLSDISHLIKSLPLSHNGTIQYVFIRKNYQSNANKNFSFFIKIRLSDDPRININYNIIDFKNFGFCDKNLFSLLIFQYCSQTVPELTKYYRLYLPSLKVVTKPLRIDVYRSYCQYSIRNNDILMFVKGYLRGHSRKYIFGNESDSTSLTLSIPKAQFRFSDSKRVYPFLELFINNQCQYSIKISMSLVDWITMLMRIHGSRFIALIFLHCSLTYIVSSPFYAKDLKFISQMKLPLIFLFLLSSIFLLIFLKITGNLGQYSVLEKNLLIDNSDFLLMLLLSYSQFILCVFILFISIKVGLMISFKYPYNRFSSIFLVKIFETKFIILYLILSLLIPTVFTVAFLIVTYLRMVFLFGEERHFEFTVNQRKAYRSILFLMGHIGFILLTPNTYVLAKDIFRENSVLEGISHQLITWILNLTNTRPDALIRVFFYYTLPTFSAFYVFFFFNFGCRPMKKLRRKRLSYILKIIVFVLILLYFLHYCMIVLSNCTHLLLLSVIFSEIVGKYF